jgi:serine/threonine-protein kinase
MLADRFCLKQPLGRGAMGSVWAARDEKLHCDVAVKFLDTDLAASQTAIDRFSREALAVSRIASIHVVKVLDYGVVSNRLPYMVLERLRGFDLEELLERDHVLSVETTLELVKQTCRALAAAHRAGIIHRDIKPSNIFLAADGNELFVYVFDFGVAKLAEPRADGRQLTMPNTVIGTLEYMSPEQAMGMADQVDERADLYALGVVAFRCMTGRPPYLTDSLGELLAAIVKGQPPAPSSICNEIPEPVDEFVRKAIAIDREDRYSCAEEMGRAVVHLQKALDTRRIVPQCRPQPKSVTAGDARAPADALRAMAERVSTATKAPGEPDSSDDVASRSASQTLSSSVKRASRAHAEPHANLRAAVLKTIERHCEPLRRIVHRAHSEAQAIAPQLLGGRRIALGATVRRWAERGVYWCRFVSHHHREAVLLGAALLGATLLMAVLIILL